MSVWSYTRPDGFRDHDPQSTRRVARVERTILAACRNYGFDRVAVPAIEYADLYDQRRIGDDFYHQLLVSRIAEAREFPSGGPRRGGAPAAESTHEVVLRPDLTTPVARAFVTRVLEQGVPSALPVRMCYGGEVFRNVSPRDGRLKAFRQVGVESVGLGGRAADLEILRLACDISDALQISDGFLTIGHAALCPRLVEALGVRDPRARDAVVAGIRRHDRLSRRLRAGGRALRQEVRRYAAMMAGGEVMGDSIDPEDADDTALRSWVLAHQARRLQVLWREGHRIDADLARRLLDLVHLDPRPEAFVADVADRVPMDSALGSVLDEMAWQAEQVRVGRRVRVEMSPVSARPMGYYDGLTFESFARASGGALVRFSGGGRYDQLYRWIYRRAVATARLHGVPPPGAFPASLLRGVGCAFSVERVLAVVPVPALQEEEIRITGAGVEHDLLALSVADGVRRRSHRRVAWYPAPASPSHDTALQGSSDAGASWPVWNVVVRARDADRVVATRPDSGQTWAGSLEQVVAGIVEASGGSPVASGEEKR